MAWAVLVLVQTVSQDGLWLSLFWSRLCYKMARVVLVLVQTVFRDVYVLVQTVFRDVYVLVQTVF